MVLSDDVVFTQLFEYYRMLMLRRWQYFTTVTVVDGLLLNVWKDLELNASPQSHLILFALGIGAIFMIMLSLQLVSRIRRRIYATALEVNKRIGFKALEAAPPQTVAWSGVTIWIYFSYLFLVAPWFIILWTTSPILSVSVTVIFLAFFIFGITWRLSDPLTGYNQ